MLVNCLKFKTQFSAKDILIHLCELISNYSLIKE